MPWQWKTKEVGRSHVSKPLFSFFLSFFRLLPLDSGLLPSPGGVSGLLARSCSVKPVYLTKLRSGAKSEKPLGRRLFVSACPHHCVNP